MSVTTTPSPREEEAQRAITEYRYLAKQLSVRICGRYDEDLEQLALTKFYRSYVSHYDGQSAVKTFAWNTMTNALRSEQRKRSRQQQMEVPLSSFTNQEEADDADRDPGELTGQQTTNPMFERSMLQQRAAAHARAVEATVADSPEKILFRRAAQDKIYAALERLKEWNEEEYTAIYMRYWEDTDFKTIAKTLCLSTGSIANYLNRGLFKLFQILTDKV